jgi:hypothetical protein
MWFQDSAALEVETGRCCGNVDDNPVNTAPPIAGN